MLTVPAMLPLQIESFSIRQNHIPIIVFICFNHQQYISG